LYLLLIIDLVGCNNPVREPTAPPPSVQAPASDQAAVSKALAGPKATAPIDYREKVRAIILERGKRQQCNDVTGCPMVATLVALGSKAAPAVEDAFRHSKGDAFWRLSMLTVLGRIGNARSADFLLETARGAPKVAIRARAAMALARLRHKPHLATIKALLPTLKPDEELQVILALGYTVALMGDDYGRDVITEHFVLPPEPYHRWDRLRPGVVAIGKLRMKSLLPRLSEITRRGDPFVRRDGARALGDLRDLATVETLIELLGDKVPSVREAAQQALSATTGLRHKRSREQWLRWWTSRSDRGD